MSHIKIVSEESLADLEYAMNATIEEMSEQDFLLCSWDYISKLNAIVMTFVEKEEYDQ